MTSLRDWWLELRIWAARQRFMDAIDRRERAIAELYEARMCLEILKADRSPERIEQLEEERLARIETQ